MSHTKKNELTEVVLEVLPTSPEEKINKRIEQNTADISLIKKLPQSFFSIEIQFLYW